MTLCSNCGNKAGLMVGDFCLPCDGYDPVYVYIMEAVGSGACKIGISKDPQQRKLQSAVDTMSPFETLVRYQFEFDSRESARKFELEAHRALSVVQIKPRREWFAGTPEQIATALSNVLFDGDGIEVWEKVS